MTVIFARETDTLTLVLTESVVAESDEDQPGVILDYDVEGDSVSLSNFSLRLRRSESVSRQLQPGTTASRGTEPHCCRLFMLAHSRRR